MKTKLLLVLGLFTISALGQGFVVINQVPVTNGLTGTLADSSIVAAVYYGAVGSAEDTMAMATKAFALVDGYARFGSQTGLMPIFYPGSSRQFDVRAWSSGYPSYESAVASGLPSALVGKSILLTTTFGGPGPASSLSFPGFTVYAVPEPSVSLLTLMGIAGFLWRKDNRGGCN